MSRFAGHDLVCVRGERSVFAGVEFAVASGQALLLRGPNGSGKSSLLRLMSGLLAPAAGRLAWDGAPIDADPEAHRRRLHYLGHQDAVKPVLSVAENLVGWARLRGVTDAAAVDGALDRFALGPLADLPARLLSAGQRRRLALARLVAVPVALWLLDEPATALDDDSAGRLVETIAAHRRAGGLVVLSSHGDPGFAAAELSLAGRQPAPAEPAW